MTKRTRQLDFLAEQYENKIDQLMERINKLELQMTLLWPAKIYDLEKSYAKDADKIRQMDLAI
jgi:hypothetical protein